MRRLTSALLTLARIPLLGCILLTTFLHAQTDRVRIRITDGKGATIALAEVSLLDAKGKAEQIQRSNRLGQVSFVNLMERDCKFVIEAEGFAKREITVPVRHNDETKMIDVALIPKKR